jgi:hypothetical protein
MFFFSSTIDKDIFCGLTKVRQRAKGGSLGKEKSSFGNSPTPDGYADCCLR